MPDWREIVREHLGPLKLSGASESEILDELAQHLEDRYQELLASGMSEAKACELTIEPLKDSPLLAEVLLAHRPAALEAPSGPANPFAFLLYDLRMALRGMCRKPGFSFLVVGLLALGIAGNTAIFSAFNSLFLKSLPFPESSRLIDVNETAPRWNLSTR